MPLEFLPPLASTLIFPEERREPFVLKFHIRVPPCLAIVKINQHHQVFGEFSIPSLFKVKSLHDCISVVVDLPWYSFNIDTRLSNPPLGSLRQ